MTLTTFCASAFNLAMSGCSACAHSGAVKTSKSPISNRFINSPRSLSVLYHTTLLGNPLHSSLVLPFQLLKQHPIQHRGVELRHADHFREVLGFRIKLFVRCRSPKQSVL